MKTTKVEVAPIGDPGNNLKDRKCFVTQVLQQLLLMMRVFGIMYTSTELDLNETCLCTLDEREDTGQHSQQKHKQCRRMLQLAYIALINIVVFSNTVKFLYCTASDGYHAGTVKSQFSVSFSILLTTSNAVLPISLIQFSRYLVPFLRSACGIQNKYRLHISWSSIAPSRAKVRCVLFLFMAFTATSFALLSHHETAYMVTSFSRTVACPVQIGNSLVNVIFNIWFAFSIFTCITVTFFSTLLFVGFCNISSRLFYDCQIWLQKYNEDNKKTLNEDHVKCLSDILAFHQDVYQVVKEGNDLFKCFVLVIYTMTVPIICFSANGLAHTLFGSWMWIITAFNEMFTLTFLIFIVFKAAKINTEASGSLSEVFNIKPHDPAGKDIYLASFFAVKLTELPTGMSLMDMLVINKSHILALLSFLGTYTVIIFQMDLPSVLKGGNSNSTLEE